MKELQELIDEKAEKIVNNKIARVSDYLHKELPELFELGGQSRSTY